MQRKIIVFVLASYLDFFSLANTKPARCTLENCRRNMIGMASTHERHCIAQLQKKPIEMKMR